MAPHLKLVPPTPIDKARRREHKAIAKGLKMIRADAKAGHVKAIAMVVVHEDGTLAYGLLGDDVHGWANLLAGTTCLQALLVEATPRVTG